MTVIKIGCPRCGQEVTVNVPDDENDHSLEVTCPGCGHTSHLTITEGEIDRVEKED